jgi:hypothetical protein
MVAAMTTRDLTPGEVQGRAPSSALGASAILIPFSGARSRAKSSAPQSEPAPATAGSTTSYDPDTVSLVVWSLFICVWLLIPVIGIIAIRLFE